MLALKQLVSIRFISILLYCHVALPYLTTSEMLATVRVDRDKINESSDTLPKTNW